MPKVQETTLFIDKLYPTVEKNIKVNSSKFMRYIEKYIDRNNESLFIQGPSKRLFFSEDDKDIVFECIGLEPKEIKTVIKECDIIDSSWKIVNDPFNMAMALIIRYYEINKKKKELKYALTYFTLKFYSSIQFRQFKYEPNENIMAYTINNLSNKYKIKKSENMFFALVDTAEVSHETYHENIAKGYDYFIKDYIMALNTRISKMIINITSEFEKVRAEGKYLNTEEDQMDEENFYMTDNTSFAINKIATSTTNKLIINGVDKRITDTAANLAGVSQSALNNAVRTLLDQQNENIQEVITLILQIYLMDGDNTVESISSKNFFIFCSAIYIKSNTNDETILKIKDLLNEWLELCSPNYVKTQRIATKNNFRKALFFFFVFAIQNSV